MTGTDTKDYKTLPGSDLPIVGLIHLLILYVAWGSTYLAIRIAVDPVDGFPPFFLGMIRVFPAGVILLSLQKLRGGKILPTRSELYLLMATGVLMWVGGNGLVNWAEQRADSGFSALIVGSMPIYVALLEAVIDRRSPSFRLIGGLVVGFAGLVVLSYPVLREGSTGDLLSVIALFMAPLFWSIGMILLARRPVKLGSLAISGWQQLFGSVGFLVFHLVVAEPIRIPGTTAWLAYGYLVVAGSLLAYTSLMIALRILPASLVATYAYVNPVIAVFLGWLILREELTVWTIAGAVLVLLGVGVVFEDRRRRNNAARKAAAGHP